MPTTSPTVAVPAEPLELRSGMVLANRLVKAAMTEGLADRSGDPSPFTGNVMVDPLADDAALRRWAETGVDVVELSGGTHEAVRVLEDDPDDRRTRIRQLERTGHQ